MSGSRGEKLSAPSDKARLRLRNGLEGPWSVVGGISTFLIWAGGGVLEGAPRVARSWNMGAGGIGKGGRTVVELMDVGSVNGVGQLMTGGFIIKSGGVGGRFGGELMTPRVCWICCHGVGEPPSGVSARRDIGNRYRIFRRW